jgi:hypothetical protein
MAFLTIKASGRWFYAYARALIEKMCTKEFGFCEYQIGLKPENLTSAEENDIWLLYKRKKRGF